MENANPLDSKTRRRLLARARRARARSRASYLDPRDPRADAAHAAAALASRLTLAADGRHCYDCGAEFPAPPAGGGAAGYAVLIGERARAERDVRICYACADRRQRADFAKADAFACYLTRDAEGRKILSTWTGGELARVTCSWTRDVGFGRDGRTYFNATAPDGARWHGTSPGFGMYARARRSKAKRSKGNA